METTIKAPIKIYLDDNFNKSYEANYEPNYQLALEWETDVNPEDIQGVLSDIFSSLNIGSPFEEMIELWQKKGLRSLSVCDVVVIGETAFRCDPTGWSVLDAQEILAYCP